MAMTTGTSGGNMSDINVTPMIDILLVLLIIFMVIVPVTPKGLEALVPQPPKTPQPMANQERTIVVQVLYRQGAAPAYKINEIDVDKRELLSRLTEIYANRAERVMFVRGDDNVDFRYIADVIDIGRAANVDHIGLMTPKIMAGQ
jgi:biopolymer transport protein ExbD